MGDGWSQNKISIVAELNCGVHFDEVRLAMENVFWGSQELFLNWLAMKLNTERSGFERAAIQKSFEELQEFFEWQMDWRKTRAEGVVGKVNCGEEKVPDYQSGVEHLV